MISASLLASIAGQRQNPVMEAIAPELEAQLAASDIGSPLRRAHFLSQCCYESGYFSRLEENLHYSSTRIGEIWPRLLSRAYELAGNPEALGNAAYALRNGNGDEASGDGFRFRGRGLLQVTGRSNYAAVSAGCSVDFVASPDLVAQPFGAVRTAIAFWESKNINIAADDDNIVRVTRAVNGSLNGLTDRAFIKQRALKLLAN